MALSPLFSLLQTDPSLVSSGGLFGGSSLIGTNYSSLFANTSVSNIFAQFAASLPVALPQSTTVTAPQPGPTVNADVISGAGVVINVTGISGVTNGLASITVNNVATAGQVTGSATVTNATTLQGGGSLTITGPTGSNTLSTTAGETTAQFVQAVNSSDTGVSASLTTTGKVQLATSDVGSSQTVTVTQASGNDVTSTLGLANGTGTGTNATASVNGVIYTGQGNNFNIGGAGAGSSVGLQFTAANTGTTQIALSSALANVGPSINTGGSQGTSSAPVFTAFSISQASRHLVNALVANQFAFYSPQQNLFSWLQGGNAFGGGIFG